MVKIILKNDTVAIHYNLYTEYRFLMEVVCVSLVVEILFVMNLERRKMSIIYEWTVNFILTNTGQNLR